MENLNAEQVKKALECCGTKDKCCSSCPLAKDYSPCSKTMAENALALIKQLTEENERLRAEKETLEIYNKDYKYKNKELTAFNRRWAKECADLQDECEYIRADTVRKMQERTAEIIGDLVELVFDDSMPNCIVPHCHKPDSIGCGHRICIDENKKIWLEKLDQIAKEMLEDAE